MFGFHISNIFEKSPVQAVKYGFISWALLIVSCAIIFAVVSLIKIYSKNRKRDKKPE